VAATESNDRTIVLVGPGGCPRELTNNIGRFSWETPYGDVPDNLVKGMSVQEMHDYLAARGRYRRRAVLKGSGVLGLAAATATFWR